jgi:hypothetical protein
MAKGLSGVLITGKVDKIVNPGQLGKTGVVEFIVYVGDTGFNLEFSPGDAQRVVEAFQGALQQSKKSTKQPSARNAISSAKGGTR